MATPQVTSLVNPNAINRGGATPFIDRASSGLQGIDGLHVSDSLLTSPVAAAQDAAVGSSVSSAATQQAAAQRAAAQASIANTNKAIGSLDTELNTGYSNIDRQAGQIASQYDRENSQNEGDYTDQTTTVNQNLAKNKQNALLAAAQGARGLRSTLAALGALGGDGLTLANRAVSQAANQDLGGAVDTAATNQTTLDKAIGKYRDDDKARRQALEDSKANQRMALEGSVESKRQQYFQKLADTFSGIGDTGNATSYLNRAGDLNNVIAQKTAVQATPITAQSAAFTPGSLAEYLAGAGDMTVSTDAGDTAGLGISPTSIFASGNRDKKKTA